MATLLRYIHRMRYPGDTKLTAEERFWSKVDKNGPIHKALRSRCWVWRGSFQRRYPQLRLVRNGKVTMWGGHKFSWEIHYGPIPKGLMVLHRCDNPSCVRPTHLKLGTAKDNAADSIRRGTFHFLHGPRAV